MVLLCPRASFDSGNGPLSGLVRESGKVGLVGAKSRRYPSLIPPRPPSRTPVYTGLAKLLLEFQSRRISTTFATENSASSRWRHRFLERGSASARQTSLRDRDRIAPCSVFTDEIELRPRLDRQVKQFSPNRLLTSQSRA